MKSKKQTSQAFDHDFEVTYEEDILLHNLRSTDKIKKSTPYLDEEDIPERPVRRRQRHQQERLAAPIQQGMNLASRVSATLIRSLTFFLILAIIGVLAYNFWLGSALYGDLETATYTGEFPPALAAYIATAGVFLLFEVLSLFWSMTRSRERDRYGTFHIDRGRGLFSFIFIFLCSYAAFLFSSLLPETPDAIQGVRGALLTFGSSHIPLFGLCVAGVIVCLIRKYKG